MALGEKKFSTSGKQSVKQTFPVLPAGTYSLKLHSDKAEARKADGEGKFPYVSVRFEALDSAVSEGGKNQSVFHMFFTAMKEQKNGVMMIARADQLIGFARAVGVDFDGDTIVMQDENGNDVECIDPRELVRWLKSLDGTIVQAKTKVQKASGGYSEKAQVDYFIESDEASGPDAGGSGDYEEESGEQSEEEEVEPEPVVKKPAKGKAPAKAEPKRAGGRR